MRRINTTHKAADLFGPGKDGFRNGDMGTGIMPTELNAEWFNMMQEEIAGVVEAAGLALNSGNSAQLQEAIKRMIDIQAGNYALDTGAANAYVVALDPVISAYVNGMTVRVRFSNTNTGASTLNAGPGNKALCNDVGGALVGGDAPAGGIASVTFDAALDKFLINSLVPSQALSQAAADVRYILQSNLATVAVDPTFADNSTKSASTGWIRGAMASIATAAGFASSFGASGYVKLPSWLGGLLIQWGQFTTSAAGYTNLTFPIAFPNAMLAITANPTQTTANNTCVDINLPAKTTTYVPIAQVNTAGAYQVLGTTYITVGY